MGQRYSKGVCQKCGRVKIYDNHIPFNLMRNRESGFQTGESKAIANDIIYGNSKRGML